MMIVKCLLTGCADGDVMISENSYPMLFHGKIFHPICKKSFQNNAFGISLFCKKLGYQSGKVVESDVKLIANAINVGTCTATDEDLLDCDGRGSFGDDTCASEKNSGMKIVCIGGSGRSHSCKGKFSMNLSYLNSQDIKIVS